MMLVDYIPAPMTSAKTHGEAELEVIAYRLRPSLDQFAKLGFITSYAVRIRG
jgi:hypothetical protein